MTRRPEDRRVGDQGNGRRRFVDVQCNGGSRRVPRFIHGSACYDLARALRCDGNRGRTEGDAGQGIIASKGYGDIAVAPSVCVRIRAERRVDRGRRLVDAQQQGCRCRISRSVHGSA